jgi:hypothetical protein
MKNLGQYRYCLTIWNIWQSRTCPVPLVSDSKNSTVMILMLIQTVCPLYCCTHTLINETYLLDYFWWISLHVKSFPDANQKLQLASVYRPTDITLTTNLNFIKQNNLLAHINMFMYKKLTFIFVLLICIIFKLPAHWLPELTCSGRRWGRIGHGKTCSPSCKKQI